MSILGLMVIDLTISGQEKSREMYEECHKIKVGENEYRQMKNVFIAHSRNDSIIKSTRPLESCWNYL